MNASVLETFENPEKRDYIIHIELPEFTALCPRTGNPDFAQIVITYVPDTSCVELKSLRLFIQSYRNDAVYHEAVTNQIFTILADLLSPKYLRVIGDFNRRGNVKTVVTVEKKFAPYKHISIPEYTPKAI